MLESMTGSYSGQAEKPSVHMQRDSTAPHRYSTLKRNLILIMLTVSLLPLIIISVISHTEAQRAMKEEAVAPLKTLVNKTTHSFELFLAERKSAISFIASAYEFEELADQQGLESIFNIMTKEFGGFVDLGLIDTSGIQASYVGPYELEGKDYDEHEWFQEVMVKGEHISDVFLGYRSFPHFVIAVKHTAGSRRSWILRATIDTERFDELIASMGLGPESDAFVLNKSGFLQTDSSLFGETPNRFPLAFTTARGSAVSDMVVDENGRELLLVSSAIPGTPFVLMVVKPRDVVLRSWEELRGKMMAVFLVSVLVILATVITVSTRMVRRINLADLKREAALHNMEHANKLASVGRLAAGVAHEINNPMAIINEKAGLMLDLVATQKEMPHRERFLQLTGAIIQSVERCSKITHRLLGFARRMDVSVEKVDVNEVIHEVVSFLEREAEHRNIELKINLADDLPRIESDHGQLQQVFLNILNNALDAIDSEGSVAVESFLADESTISVSIEDNGCGMSREVKAHVFEPFFTTRGAEGTGLGLSITYGLVQRLGGTIDLISEEGIGTKFVVNLPFNQPPGRE